MPKMLSINIGHVTNSSSVVYHFPKVLLADKNVQAFLAAFEIDTGYVGEELWGRNTCGTFAVTREQKALASERLHDTEYGSGPGIDIDDENTVVVIIGDEYQDITSVLCGMLRELGDKSKLSFVGQDYN